MYVNINQFLSLNNCLLQVPTPAIDFIQVGTMALSVKSLDKDIPLISKVTKLPPLRLPRHS